MLKSCQYCGRIHDTKDECDPKRKAREARQGSRRRSSAYVFHKSKAWTRKSIQVRERDHYTCVCCKAKLEGTLDQYNTEDLSVHHITPIEEDYSLRLDEDNLITVCRLHHEMCEAGKIPRDVQRSLIGGENEGSSAPVVM